MVTADVLQLLIPLFFVMAAQLLERRAVAVIVCSEDE
jgi:hypothetical protein